MFATPLRQSHLVQLDVLQGQHHFDPALFRYRLLRLQQLVRDANGLQSIIITIQGKSEKNQRQQKVGFSSWLP